MTKSQAPGQILALFFRYVSLNVLGMIGLSCYILADTFFISLGLGETGLAALNLAIPVYSFISACGILAGIGGSTQFAAWKGAGRKGTGDRVFTQTLLTAALLSLPLVAAGLFFARPMSLLLGADAATLADTQVYLRTLLLFSPAFLLNQALLFFVRADGGPGLAMAGMLTGSFSNILLDWVLIFPLHMGMAGAVLATCIAPLLSLFVLSFWFTRRKNSFHPVRLAPKQLGGLKRIFALGAGAWITETSSGMVMVLLNLIFFRLRGNTGVAAYGIVANLALVALSIFSGVSQGVQPLFSSQYGAGNRTALHRTLRLALGTALVLALLLWAAILLLSTPLAAVFNQNGEKELTELAANGLRLYFSGFLFAGFNLVLGVLFSCIGRPAASMAVSLLRGILLVVPFALLFSLAGTQGVWLAVPASELLTAVTGALLYRHFEKNAGPTASGKEPQSRPPAG